MKRRDFIKSAGIAVAATVTIPYILPSGRLFAASGAPLVKHVVFVLFAGGVRQQESVLQEYVSNQPLESAIGNIMPNLLTGPPPTSKIAYGSGTNGDIPITPILNENDPNPLKQTLQEQGTLFQEVQYSKGGTGHYFGRNSVLAGVYAGFGQGLKARPVRPTIFEYLRRHRGEPATKVWFLGNSISGSIPLLNYSEHADYGAQYGANVFVPNTTFTDSNTRPRGEEHLGNQKLYHPINEIAPMREMKDFLDNAYATSGTPLPDIGNTDEEKEQIKNFIKTTYENKTAGLIPFPPEGQSGDLGVIGYACELLKTFKPTLLVIDMQNVDVCHTNYTYYLQALHRGDHGVGYLWDYIQTQIPEMMDDTAMIIIPEHGRNLNTNSVIDVNSWGAIDHDSDANSRRVFSMLIGPSVSSIPQGLVKGAPGNPVGDSTDIVPTIAELLGFSIPNGNLDVNATSMFQQF